jgi:hypothetical protein
LSVVATVRRNGSSRLFVAVAAVWRSRLPQTQPFVAAVCRIRALHSHPHPHPHPDPHPDRVVRADIPVVATEADAKQAMPSASVSAGPALRAARASVAPSA